MRNETEVNGGGEGEDSQVKVSFCNRVTVVLLKVCVESGIPGSLIALVPPESTAKCTSHHRGQSVGILSPEHREIPTVHRQSLCVWFS